MLAWSAVHAPTRTRILRTDNALGYTSKLVAKACQKHGIKFRTTTPHQPQENSRAKRNTLTLVSAARAVLHHANLNDTHWEDAVWDAAYM